MEKDNDMTEENTTNTMPDDVSREIARKEHPEYDSRKLEIFISGFADGYHQAEKDPVRQSLTSSALEKLATYDNDGQAAFVDGFLRGFQQKIAEAEKNTLQSEKNPGKISVSQENFVSLHRDNVKTDSYGTADHRRAAESAAADHAPVRQERLGVHAYMAQGRPTLDRRWDTLVYEEGLQPEPADRQLGGPLAAIRRESDRLIAVAKEVGDYIPSTVWETFGIRNTAPSGESVVFLDDKNDRVVKFKDPFAFAYIKENNPYNALYEHHIHNFFFGNAAYRFLGVSQDPVSGGVRLAFEQPFILSSKKPTEEEIEKWFNKRGFKIDPRHLFFTDGYVSFTDVWNDNCIKDLEGNLHFIDPVIKFNREPKEVLSHYIGRMQAVNERLDRAGIAVGSRFRIDHLCSDNDREVVAIDYGSETVTLREYNTSAYHDGKPFEWSVKGLLDEIKYWNAYRWVQIDDHRNDIVIPEARRALVARANDPSPAARFTDEQIKAIDRYCTLYSDETPKREVLQSLFNGAQKDLKTGNIFPEWIEGMHEELMEYAEGHRREENGLKLT